MQIFFFFFFFFFFRDHSELTMANLFNTHETNIIYIPFTYIHTFQGYTCNYISSIQQLQILDQCINVCNFFHAKLSAFFIYS